MIDRKQIIRYKPNVQPVGNAPENIINLIDRNITVPSDFMGFHNGGVWYEGGESGGTTYPNAVSLVNNTDFTAWRSHDSRTGDWFYLALPLLEGGAGYNFTALKARFQANKAVGRTNFFTLHGTPKLSVVGPKVQQFVAGKTYPLTGTTDALYVYPSPANRNARRYKVITAGVAGAEPVWPKTGGNVVDTIPNPATVTSGGVTFQEAPLFLSNYGPGYADPADSQDIYNFITALLTECNTTEKLIDYIEVRNEPGFHRYNVSAGMKYRFYFGEASDLVRECHVVAGAIKDFSGHKPLLGGCGFTRHDQIGSTDDASTIIAEFLSAYDDESGKYGYEIPFDFISYHEYQGIIGYKENLTTGSNNIIFGTFIRKIKDVFTSFGLGGLPFYNSEGGITLSLTTGAGSTTTTADKFANTTTASERKTIIELMALNYLCANVKQWCVFYASLAIDGYGTNANTNWLQDTNGLKAALTEIKSWKLITKAEYNRLTDTYTFVINGVQRVYTVPPIAYTIGLF